VVRKTFEGIESQLDEYLISSSIFKPSGQISDVAAKIAKGNIEQAVDYQSKQ